MSVIARIRMKNPAHSGGFMGAEDYGVPRHATACSSSVFATT